MYEGKLVGFDTETTGVNVFSDDVRVVTCAMVMSEGPDAPNNDIEWLMDPEIEIPTGASDVHGITTEVAQRDGMGYAEGMQKIADALTYTISEGIPLTAYNGAFDATLLRVEFLRIGTNFDDDLWDKMVLFDPMVMDKFLDPWRKGGQKLIRVSELYGYDLTSAHQATADVCATIHIARRIIPKFVEKAERTFESNVESTDDIMSLQKALYRKSKTELEAYFRSPRSDKPNDITINKSWPFQDRDVD